MKHGTKRRAPSEISLGAVLGALFALFAFGCQLVTGDFKIEPPAQTGSGAAQCKTGDYRCNGEYLLACGAGDAGWVLKQTCGNTDLCDSKNKQCEVCKPGDGRCDGVVREQCRNDGKTWQQIQSCSSADMCNPTFCGNCMPGEYSCRGENADASSELWQCGTDGTWSLHLDDCATPGLCSSTLDAARANPNFAGKCMMGLCDAGTYRCDGPTLEHCRQDETAWDTVDTCATAALCATAVASDAATMGSLDMCPVGCSAAGAYLCTGMTLTKCRDDLTGFDSVTTCTDPNTECNPVVGACTDLCTPGQYQCNDKSLRRCTSTRHWENVSDCASAALCTTAADASSGQCLPPGCPHAGDYACSGATLSKCAEDLSGFVAVTTCASAELCDATDKRCNDPVCTPANSYQCFDVSVDGNVESQLRQCNAGQTAWVDVGDACPAGQFCSNDGADPGCKTSCPSSTRCNGSELQTCTADSGWVHQATCATTNLCSCTLDDSCAGGNGADGCGVAICGGSLPTAQCNGAELQSCDAGRNGWDDQSDCGALGCMDAGATAYCAACHAGDASCIGSTLQVCPPDQRAVTTRQCGVASLCDAANKECDVCTPPDSSVCSNGNVLQHCSDDGQMLQSTTCPKLCNAAANRCDTCMPGTSRCSNNVLYTCGTDGKTETPTTCDSNAHCDAANNRCVTCLPTEYHCNGAELQTCNASQTGWSDKTACGSSALCSASAGKCLTCLPTDYHCNGAELQTCNSSQTGWSDKTACSSSALCSASAGKCLTCLPTDFNCNGAELQTCNSMQTGWTDKTACASAPLCDKAGGKCIPPACQPTDFHCAGAELQTCNSTQTDWADKTLCASAALCDEASGVCKPVVCQPGDYNCTTTGELQKCSGMQDGWDDKMACGSAALCDEADGKCLTCTPTDYNCTAAGELQKCNAMQSGWDDVMACGSAALCDKANGACKPVVCQPGDYNCTATGELQKCNAMQDGWDDQMACGDPSLCDKANGACLPECTAGTFECTNNVLYTCDMTGHFPPTGTDCGTGSCDATAGMCNPSMP